MEVIRCDLPVGDCLAWRYPNSTPLFGAQVVVSQTQKAALIASGQLIALLEPGIHTLDSVNIPGFERLLPGGAESFPLDIWFVNLTASTTFKWGTKTPVQVRESQYGLLVPIGSYGNYEASVVDIQKFLLRIVGVASEFLVSDLREYLYPLVEREAKDAIAELAVRSDVFTLSTELNEISDLIRQRLDAAFSSYGISLRNFFVQSLSVLSDDPAFEKIKSAISDSAVIRMRAQAVQDSEAGYRTERSLDVLEKLAGNEGGVASAFAGAGLGLGAGLNLGSQFSTLSQPTPSSDSPPAAVDLLERLRVLKEMLDLGAITQDDYDQKKKSILDQL